MKLKDSWACWAPNWPDCDNPENRHVRGKVRIGSKEQVWRWSDHKVNEGTTLNMWNHVAYGDPKPRENISAGELKYREISLMFANVMAMIIRDKIDPDAIHKEYLKIEEYRNILSEDVPGVATSSAE